MPLTPLQRIDRLSTRQYGLILRRQALTAGLTSRQIDRLLALKRWLSIERGVYLVAAVPPSWQQRALAACLSRPEPVVASHLTAAALHGLCRPPPRPHITGGPNASGRSRLAIVHRMALDTRERVVVAGVPTTSVTRTLVDCATMVGAPKLAELVDAALCAQLTHPTVLARSSRHKPGGAQLRRVVEVWTPGIAPGSPAEMRLLRQTGDWGFPPPVSQIELRDGDGRLIGRIDLGWPAVKLGLEYDADLTHNPRHWDRDEGRHPRYAAMGWQVYRVDKVDLRPGQTWLRELLASRLLRWAS